VCVFIYLVRTSYYGYYVINAQEAQELTMNKSEKSKSFSNLLTIQYELFRGDSRKILIWYSGIYHKWKFTYTYFIYLKYLKLKQHWL
jgi:hypothetical protein